MAYTKYSLTPANNNAAPPDGAPEGMLPSAVNDTMRDMMAQIRDVGDGIRDGTYTMTTPKITGGTITGVTFSSGAATITGGTITGITDLAVADGGTGASTASGARTNLGLDGFVNMKNRIINGAMVIAQRTTASINVDNSAVQYPVDRFFCYGTQASSKFAVQQAGVTLDGFTTSIKATSSSAYSVTSSDNFYICQNIEGFNVADLGWGAAGAKTVTLSFKVYSSLTGTFGGALLNDGYALSYPFSYSIPTANTWTTISVTIAGPTSGTWLTNNGVGIRVYFSLGTGTTGSSTAGSWQAGTYYSATGATSVVGTNGATFYITGVQLEVGSTATSFDYRPYTTEFQLAQRYYQRSSFGTTTYPSSTGYARAYASFAVVMRAAPTMAFTDLGSGGSSLASGSYVDGYYNTYQSLGASSAGTFSWTASAEL